ncbi:hypothetical protein, partial [Microcystis aeruginosa]|uniref:hypothetical protein n=1 Tax=Microcystis aeruginosa TaxID=1126 RepID=UPI001C10A3BE
MDRLRDRRVHLPEPKSSSTREPEKGDSRRAKAKTRTPLLPLSPAPRFFTPRSNLSKVLIVLIS